MEAPGGRLKEFWQEWVGLDKWVVKTLRYELKLKFKKSPFSKESRLKISRETPETVDAIRELEEKSVLKKFIEEGYLSSFFVIRQGEKMRPIMNCAPLNEYITPKHFKIKDLKTMAMSGDWMVKVDIKDAYLHVPMHSRYRKYLQIKSGETRWTSHAMMFKLNVAPQIFTRIMRATLKPLRKKGFRIIAYLDDLLLLADSQRKAEEQGHMLVTHLKRLGLLRTSPNGRCFIKATNEKPSSGGTGVTQTPLSLTRFLDKFEKDKTGGEAGAGVSRVLGEHKGDAYQSANRQACQDSSRSEVEIDKGNMPTSKMGIYNRSDLVSFSRNSNGPTDDPLHAERFESGSRETQRLDQGRSSLSKPGSSDRASVLGTTNKKNEWTPLRESKTTAQLWTDDSSTGWGAILDNQVMRGSWKGPELSLRVAALYSGILYSGLVFKTRF